MGQMAGSLVRLCTCTALITFLLSAPPQARAGEGDSKADAPEEQVYDIDKGITPPRVTHQVNPRYASDSRGFRLSGSVLVGLVVSSHGEPKDVRVLRSLDKDIDQSAVEAVREWRFEPAKKDGHDVAVRISVEIRFRDM